MRVQALNETHRIFDEIPTSNKTSRTPGYLEPSLVAAWPKHTFTDNRFTAEAPCRTGVT